MFDCSLMRIQSNHQSASGTTVRRQPHLGGCVSCHPGIFWMVQEAPHPGAISGFVIMTKATPFGSPCTKVIHLYTPRITIIHYLLYKIIHYVKPLHRLLSPCTKLIHRHKLPYLLSKENSLAVWFHQAYKSL